jgi:hypothetical protein
MATGVDIAVDFMDMRDNGRLWTLTEDVRPGFEPTVGQYAVVGDDDADPAVARIVSVDADGGIALEVLGGGVDEHRHLLTTT